MRFVRLLALPLALAACSTDLPHEAPYDALAPQDAQATATLTGRVTLEGESDFSQISIKLTNAAHTYDTETDADGRVTLSGVVPGRYAVRVGSRYFEPVTRDAVLDVGGTYDLGALELAARRAAVAGHAQAELLTGKTLATRGGVEVTLTRTATARGGLRTAAATAPTDALAFTTVSGPDGAYRITGVPAGVYALTAVRGDLPPAAAQRVEVTGDDVTVAAADVLLKAATGFLDVYGTVRGQPSARLTQTAGVTLRLAGFNAAQMRVGSAAGTDVTACVPGTAVAYATTASLTLSNEGPHVFCAVFLDDAGRASEPAYGTIVYDKTAPMLPAVSINAGAAYATGSLVTLALSALDATAGVEKMIVSQDPALAGAVAQDYVPALVYPLGAGEGARTVYVRFEDAAGNTTPIVSSAIVVDTQAPAVASFALQNAAGAPVTLVNATRVYAALDAADASPLQMLISNYADFRGSAWQPYQGLLGWDLLPPALPGGESRTVYAKVRDAAGHEVPAGSVSVWADTQAPANPSLAFAASLVTQTTVSVTLSAAGADYVELSPDIGFLAPVRFAYQTVTTVTFAAGDGVKTLFARYADDAGNYSALAAASVTLDQTPPENPAFAITEASPLNVSLLHLTLSATGAHDMAVSEGGCQPAWEPYAQTKAFALATTAPGAHTVAVRFRDAAGNVTACLTRAVVYDAVPPAATAPFRIEGGAARTANRTAALSHAVTGATEMQISEYAAFVDAAWQPYVPTSSFTLSAGDGAKTVYFRARDAAGNLSLVQSATVVLDSVAPGFNALAAPALVGVWQAGLTLSATGADRMRVSEDPLFAGAAWNAYAGVTTVTLSAGEGVKTVYVQLADLAGNLSVVRSVDVTVDATAPGKPAVEILEGAYTRTATLTLQTLADGAAEMRLAQTPGFTGAVWQPVASLRSFTLAGGDGAYRVYVQVRDGAQNVSPVASAAVTLDTAAPVITRFQALSAAGIALTTTNQTQVTLALDVTDASPAQAQFNTSNLFGGIALEPLPAYTLRRAWAFIPPSNPLGEPRSVYVRVTDLAGNQTQAGPLDVWIDSLGPTSPDVGLPALANAVTVPVSLFAQNADWVELAEDPAFLVASRFAMRAATTYTFTGGDGVHTLYARYADAQGNYSAAAAADVEIDTTPPILNAFTIREAPMTPQLTIHIAVDAQDAHDMQLAEGACGGAWTPFSAAAAYNFQAIYDGVKWIRLQLRDAAGNLSPCYASAITLDSGAPAITSILPRSDRPGAELTIFGNNFGNAAGYVILDGVRVPVSTDPWSGESWANTEIHTYVPEAAGRGLVQLRVEAGGKVSGDVSFFLFPRIDFLEPYSVDEGESLTLRGKSFGREPAGARVVIGGYDAAITGWSPTAITVTVPANLVGEGSVPLALIADGYTTSSGVGLDRVITGYSPAQGTDGTIVTIAGRGFGPLPGTVFLFGDNMRPLPVVSWSTRQIQVAVSAGGYRGDVALTLFTNVGYDIGTVNFTQTGPVLEGRTPASGAGAVTLKLVGRGFGAAPGTVTVGGVPAAVTSWTDQVVWATTDPNLRPGAHAIVVADAAGARTGTLPFVKIGADLWYEPAAFSPRTGASTVWTGAEVIVFGGTSLASGKVLADGARYNPATDDWVLIPDDPTDPAHWRTPGPRTGHVAVWNGSRMYLFGGSEVAGAACPPCNPPRSDLAYVPPMNQWLPTNIWVTPADGASIGVSPRYILAVGGRDYWGNPSWDGLIIDLVTGEYNGAYDVATNLVRQGASIVWDGARFLIYGGSFDAAQRGVAYSPVSFDWEALENAGQPAARTGAAAAWTGSEMLVWGGRDELGNALGDGARFNPQTGIWSALPAAGAPTSRYGMSALWIGSRWYLWGGSHDGVLTGDGAAYDPAGDAWAPLATAGAPSPRAGHTAVWTGARMVVWGGDAANTGASYDPAGNAWSPVRAAPLRDPFGEGVDLASLGLPAWSGSEAYWWNANAGTGVRYDASIDRSAPLPVTDGVVASQIGLVWAGDRLVALRSDGVAGGATYVPGDDFWVPMAAGGLPAPRQYATVLGAPDDTAAIVWGGLDLSWNALDDGLVYHADADTWSTLPAPPAPPDTQHLVFYADGSFYLFGGYDNTGVWHQSAKGWRYDLGTGLWSAMSQSGAPARGDADAVGFAPDLGGFYLWGGYDFGGAGSAPAVLYRYDAATDTWASFAPPAGVSGLPTMGATLTPMGDRLFIHHGYAFPDAATQAAIFDAATLTWRAVATEGMPDTISFAGWDGAKVDLWRSNGTARPSFYLPPP